MNPTCPCGKMESLVLSWGWIRFAGVILLGAPMGLPQPAAAELPSSWKNVQTFQVEKPGLVKIDLPLETLNAVRPGFEDLRLYDDTGKELPYLIDRPRPRIPQAQPAQNLHVEVANAATLIRFGSESASPLSGILLDTPARDFIKAVTLEASANGQTWNPLAKGHPVFRQPGGASQLLIPLPPGPWRFFRMSLDDQRSQPIPITGVRLLEAESAPTPEIPLEINITEREEGPGETCLTLQIPAANLVFAKLLLETTDVLFTRVVTLSVRQFVDPDIQELRLHQATLFRVAVDAQASVSNVTFAGEVQVPSRELVLKVENGDSPPLRIDNLKAFRRPVFVIFHAPQAGHYHLLSGNSQCPPPRYDLANRKELLTSTTLSSARPASLQLNPKYQPLEIIPDILPGSAIDASPWKYRKRIPATRMGTCQVDLDLDVLSRSASYSDLRLLANDRQLPFILERTSIKRAITPAVKKSDDPQRPKVSRWELTLPFARLPVTQVTLTAEEPYFRRHLQLFEETEDNLGAPQRIYHSQHQWIKTLEQKSGQLNLGLNSMRSDRLILEIDNGDNPPLNLRNFLVWYPVARVLFKTPPHQPELHLYYGNPQASAPQYDLELVAPQLLAAEKTRAVLEKEEVLKTDSWFDEFRGKGRATALFWVILTLVVVGLLYLIAKLLPKPESP